jgi:pimeloyl-ACP methyl ester carboxylesterase
MVSLPARRRGSPRLRLGAGFAGAAPPPGETAVPLGRLVAVGQHRLHLYCSGTGTPTVVLEAGLGGNHLDWIRAQPELSKTTQVCSYDRAGYGWSTVERISGELQLLLRNAGIGGPIILVGHSFGGMLSLYYTAHNADQVIGLVLIDSMHPDQYERFHDVGVEVPVEPARGIIHATPEVLTFGIPEAYRALAHQLARRESTRSSMFNELRNIRESMAQVKAAPPTAVVRAEVILHGRREWDRLYGDGRMEDLWIRLQADLARQIGATRLVVASRSGHQVALEDPALVEKIVAGVIRDLRAASD